MALSHCERAELLNERSEFSNSGHGKPSGTTVLPPLQGRSLSLPPLIKGGQGEIFKKVIFTNQTQLCIYIGTVVLVFEMIAGAGREHVEKINTTVPV